ncbi:MAG: histidinol-phosphate transaminase [Shimia sp.]
MPPTPPPSKPPEPQPGILEIELYTGGAASAPGAARVLKLSSNENPLGPSPAAMAAFTAAAPMLHRYPSTDHASVRAAIGEVHGLDPERIVMGVGSDEVFNFLAYAYAGPGDEVIHTSHGFSMYPIVARAAGAVPVEVPERDRTVDTDAILAAVTERTRMVFVANPGNPTATFVPLATLEALAEGLPSHVVLVVDGAYAEFVPGYDGGARIVEARENVVMTRTFSKLYGLGGLRIGYGYAPRGMVDVLNRLRGPFNLSAPALAAAEAAVRDTGFAARTVEMTVENRAWMVERVRALGLACDDSFANFVTPRFASEGVAAHVLAALRDEGILVRGIAGYGLPEALRITVGTREDCAAVVDGIARALEGAA